MNDGPFQEADGASHRRPSRSRWELAWGISMFLVMLVPAGAHAQRAPTGAELAALFPASLARATRTEVQTYPRFATSTYVLVDVTRLALQIHEVVGAGSAAYQRSTCPRTVRITRREVCVRPSEDGGVTLSWIFSDALQVMLGGADERTVMRLARTLDLAAIARLADAIDTHDEDGCGDDCVTSSPAPAAPSLPAPTSPRPRIVSVPSPVYPADARARGIGGRVVVEIEVAADGSLTSARTREGDPALTEAALDAVRGARFEPARDEEGRAIASSDVVVIRFDLDW